MSTVLYQTNGEVVPIAPANGVHWTLEELQALVGGYIEVVSTIDSRFMVVNEEGKVKRPMLPLNIEATRIYCHGRRDPIVGPAVVVDTRLELDGPEEEEEADD